MIAQLLDPNRCSEAVVWVPVLVVTEVTSNYDCHMHDTSESLLWFRKDSLPSIWRYAIDHNDQTKFTLDHTMRSKSSLRYFGKLKCNEADQSMPLLEKEISNFLNSFELGGEGGDISNCPPLPFVVGSKPLLVTILETV